MLVIYLRQGGYVFIPVCPLARYIKKLQTYYDDTFRDAWSCTKDQTIRISGRSRFRLILNVSLPLRDGEKLKTVQRGGGMHVLSLVNNVFVISGMKVPEDNCFIEVERQTGHWSEGKCIAFDDSFEHSVFNGSDMERVILIFDIWHPALTSIEVETIKTMFSAM